MGARHYPGLVGYPRSIWAKRDEIATRLKHALVLPDFLGDDVTKHAPLFSFEVLPAGAQFVQHAPGHENGGGQLRIRMFEFLPGAVAVIFEDADVLEPLVALEVLNALRNE